MKPFMRTTSILFVAAYISAWAGDVQSGGNSDTQPAQSTPNIEKTTMSQGNTDPSVKVQGDWRITLIGMTEVPSDGVLTLTFENAEARFFAGCNTITAATRFGLHNFRFNVTGVTEKMCDAETMATEAALIEAISRVDLLKVGPTENIAFYDVSNQLVLSAARPSS